MGERETEEAQSLVAEAKAIPDEEEQGNRFGQKKNYNAEDVHTCLCSCLLSMWFRGILIDEENP